jgi:hypothetical protein
LIPALVEARAGGGGSGGGSGGGGGGGGGGRGGGNTQIALLIFAILLFQRLYKRKYGALLILVAIIFIVSFAGIFLYTRRDGSFGSVLFDTFFGLLFVLIVEHVGGQGRWLNKNKETVVQLALWKKSRSEWAIYKCRSNEVRDGSARNSRVDATNSGKAGDKNRIAEITF